jgi:ubiquinone/menaquinone biosynthesis C-methylase UbiE
MKSSRLVAVSRDVLPTMLDHMATLADPIRCRMLLALERHELTVSELCAVLQLPQSTVSRHLKTLADAEWVESRRDGTSRYYSMSVENLEPGARRLWPLIREQVAATSAADLDERRLTSVLGRRRSKSEEFFSSASGRWDRLREELFGDAFHLHALLALVDRSLVVADLGCGTGQITELVAPHVARVIGVDSSLDMLHAARTKLRGRDGVEFRNGTLEALPIDNGEVDVAIMALVLHHVPDPSVALREAARSLRKRGRVLLIDMLPHDRAEYQQQMGHIWLGFPEKQIQKLLNGAGFADIRIHRLPVYPEAKGPALFVAIATKDNDG